MRFRTLLTAVLSSVCLAGGAAAQDVPGPLGAQAADDTVTARVPVASVMDRPSDAARRSELVPAAPLPATGKNLGSAKAQMAVGGAAIVVGALIGGNGGSALMLGGAVVGLYGLWNYLK